MPDSVLSGPADRVAWINDLINSMWPYLQTHVENTVIKKKMHENYLFMNSIMPMGVPKPLHLRVGKAPVFQGILVVDDVRDSLRIEMEMWIVGDSEVAIEYGGMQFILSNFKMKTKLRIDLGPLLYTAPLFEKVRFTCLEIKGIYFYSIITLIIIIIFSSPKSPEYIYIYIYYYNLSNLFINL